MFGEYALKDWLFLRIWMTTAVCGSILVFALSGVHAAETTAPSKDRWDPVEQLLQAGDDEAASNLLNDIVSEFPNWPHGWLKRAEVNERLNNLSAALNDSEKAYNLDPAAEEAASTHARILLRQERYADTIKVLETYLPKVDAQGWIHYYAAEAAFRLGDVDQANEFISLGLKNLGAKAPAEFRFLSGRIMEQRGDLSGAAASFRRGLSTDASMASEWFNLGVIYRQLASQGDEQAKQQATESFKTAAQLAPNDAFSWFALGQSHIDQGNYIAAESTLKRSLTVFRSNNISQGNELAVAHASYGLALLKLGEEQNAVGAHADALTQFKKAESLGLADAPLYNNMLAAAIGAQRQAKSDAERAPYIAAAETIIQGPGGQYVSAVNMGLNYFHSAQDQLKQRPLTAYRNANLAVEMLTRALEGSNEQGAIYRFIGHSHGIAMAAADALHSDAMNAGEAGEEVPWSARKDEHLDAGASAYIESGNRGDSIAQAFYLAQESNRSPRHAYDAGWKYLSWRSYIQPTGWKTVLANYGGAAAYRSPLSIGVWSVLLLAALILGLKGFFSSSPQEEQEESGSRRSANRPQPKTDRVAAHKPRPQAQQVQRTTSKVTRPPQQRATGRAMRQPERDNRTTQGISSAARPASTRRAVDDIARRMASQNRPQSTEQQKPQRTKSRRPPQRRRPS